MAVFERKKACKVTLDDTTPLSCVVESAQMMRDHTEYVLRIQRGPVAEKNWTITKRYNDFVTLDSQLKLAGFDLTLPPKKVFGNMEREFIAERQHGLQIFMQEILSNILLSSSHIVKHFLDPRHYSENIEEQALQHVQMIFRSEPHWEVVEPLTDIGSRLRKRYFMIRPKSQPKTKLVLSWSDYGPDKTLDDKDMLAILKLLPNFQHPHIYPVTYATCNDMGALAIRSFYERGTLRDCICKSKPKNNYLKKYGKRKMYTVCTFKEIQIYGKQILETLKYMHEKGFPHGNLHAGNVILEGSICKLLDIENWLLGLPSYYRAYIAQFKRVHSLEQTDVYGFGQLLYEMVFGEQLSSATCDSFPPNVDPQIRSVLESILTSEACKNGIPSVANLLSHQLFDIQLPRPAEKPQIKIPSKLKEALEQAKKATETRLKEDQKLIHQIRRISKAQAYHMSDEEKKKRRRSRKKQSEASEENGETSAPPLSPTTTLTPQSPPPPPTPTSPTAPTVSTNGDINANKSFGPPPPPPPPPPVALPMPQEAAPTSDGNERSALLSSINMFSKGGLKKVQTNDKSGPKI